MQNKEELILSYIRKSISLSTERFNNYLYDDKGHLYLQRFAYIRFEKYVKDFLSGISTDRFVVAYGLRGIGKTTIVAQIYRYIISQGVPKSNVLYVSMDEASSYIGCTLVDIINGYEYFLTKHFETLSPSDRVFIFVDEAHYDPNWALTLKSLYDKTKNVFVFVTGSSAISLTTSTDLARRARSERLFPLNYLEYNLLKNRKFPPSGVKDALERAIFQSKDVNEAYDRIKPKMGAIHQYLSDINPMQINEYLKYGTLPFAIPIKEESDIYNRILGMLEKIIFQDLESISSFNKDTQQKTMNLLTLLATSDRVNLDKLSNTLALSRPTLVECIDALEKTDLIFKVWPYGSASSHIRKTPKYKFMAPVVKTSLMWNIGSWTESPASYGLLLEDTVAMYLYREQILRRTHSIEFDPEQSSADFILQRQDNTCIVIEVGYGKKETRQVHNSAHKCNPAYSIIVSDGEFEVVPGEKILSIPKEIFLLS